MRRFKPCLFGFLIAFSTLSVGLSMPVRATAAGLVVPVSSALTSAMVPVLGDELPRETRDRWVILSIGLLAFFYGIVNYFFPGEISRIARAYYNRSHLVQLAKEDHLFSSWPFVFLYVLVGFAAGIFIYLGLASGVVGAGHPVKAKHFLLIALSVLVLFGLKIVAIRVIGFIFDISRLLRKYITVLYLGYFNTGIVLLVFATIISLMPYQQAGWLIWTAIGLCGLFLFFRVAQVAVELLINYRFPKFYLFMYLCTLEIAPVLILIKILYR